MALTRHTEAKRLDRSPRQIRPDQANTETCSRLELFPRPRKLQFRWAAVISEREWAIYRFAIETLRRTGVDFVLGGGFALAAFTGRWRDTKDIDFYIRPEDRATVVAALARAGF